VQVIQAARASDFWAFYTNVDPTVTRRPSLELGSCLQIMIAELVLYLSVAYLFLKSGNYHRSKVSPNGRSRFLRLLLNAIFDVQAWASHSCKDGLSESLMLQSVPLNQATISFDSCSKQE
jgi:hypothetical protein